MRNENKFETSNAVFHPPSRDEFVYVVVSTTIGAPHLIHLNGHDFFVIAQETRECTDDVPPKLDNPPRRDTAMLPASGYLVMAFQTDNLGAWLMHCHIGWHTSEGFAMQLVEQADKIAGLTDNNALTSNCDGWKAHSQYVGILQDDSGV
ncbi:hypothetical protein G6011_04311 [Alternaria panax]|uniref:Plastocyanin-like domain-containing protein n=1 Tax=Alternaria panax TaxID=48097 RepID=A0AAD4IG98_9PLEO|nr:hypothetical protein G6011_04311 [Alternaria panax]